MVSLRDFATIAFLGRKDPVTRLAAVEKQLAQATSEVERLTAERETIVSGLREEIQFEQILPDKKYTPLHQQLLDNERVHPLATTDELVGKRIGAQGTNKRCFARVISNGSPVVTAGIFTALQTVPNNANGEVEYQDIAGNINAVKDMEKEDFQVPSEGETAIAILYTISSSSKHEWEKGGRPLASSVYLFLHAEAKEKGYNLIVSTLSPVRNFSAWLSKQEEFQSYFDKDVYPTEEFMGFLNDEDNRDLIKSKLMEYLISQKDPVLNFHLGNGAYIGDIKFNEDNKQDWVMINYVYPSDVGMLASNQNMYSKTGMRPIAPHLQNCVSDEPELRSKVTCVIYKNGNSVSSIPNVTPEKSCEPEG